ncbi:MAG: hypothetical protein ROM54_12920 [Anaerobiospirillum sp.]|nr:hypothetical protein [Anaerobiospirillum sp.]
MGWTLLALGLLSCLFARTFKLGVLVMVLGNIPLILGIAAPRRVMEWVINQGVAPSQFPTVEQSHTLGIASGLVVFLLLFLIYWYPLGGRKGPAYYFWQNKTKRLSDDDPIMGDDGLLDSERSSKNNNKRGKNKARTSTLHLKSGDNPLSLKDTSKAHDELTQLDADREPTLSSDLFTKRGPRRAAARAMARTNQGPNAPGPNALGPNAPGPNAANARPAAAPGRAQPVAPAPAASRGTAHAAQGAGADTPPPSLGSFLSRLDAMTSGAGASPDLKPRSAIPDAVVPGGMALSNEPHVSSGVKVSGPKVSDLLHDLSEDEAGRRSAEAELKARMQAENTPHQGGMSFSDILSSASSRQSKLEASQDGFAPDNDVLPPDPDLSAGRAAAAAHGLTVRPSARKSSEPTPVDEALQEQGALADDEIELSRHSDLSAAEAASLAKTKLYSPGRTVGQALAELDQAIPAEAEVISSEQPPRADEPSDEDLITALSAADVEIVQADEISERALNEAAAAHAQDIAPERVQHIKSLEAELEAKEAALKAREAALEAQQAALKAKEAMLSLDKNESAESKGESSKAEPSQVESSQAEPNKVEPSKAEPRASEQVKSAQVKAAQVKAEVEPAKPKGPAKAAAPEMPSASYSFTLKAPHQEKPHATSRNLPQFMGDSTSYSFELDFKTNAYGKSADKDEAPTKQFKVAATFSAEDETKRVTRPHTEPAAPNVTEGQELQANLEALKAQAQAERRALSEQREQKDREAKRQRDEVMWQRAERVAHELLSEAKTLGDEVNAPTTAAQLAARAGISPTPAKDPKTQRSGHLPYALTADYTDAGQDEARSLAALLKGDSDLALTMEKVKAQTDAALIAQGITRPEGFKSLGAKANEQRISLQEDSAEVERMFEQITRVLQENSEAQLNTTPAASVAPLKPELKREELHLAAQSAFKAEPAVVGELKVHTPAESTLKIEPAAKIEPVSELEPAAQSEPGVKPGVKPGAKPAAQARPAKTDGISDNTVITRTKPPRAPEAAAPAAKSATVKSATVKSAAAKSAAAKSAAKTAEGAAKTTAASTAGAKRPAAKAAAASAPSAASTASAASGPSAASAPAKTTAKAPAPKATRAPRTAPKSSAAPTKAAPAPTALATKKPSAAQAAPVRAAASAPLQAETPVKAAERSASAARASALGRTAQAPRQVSAPPEAERKAAAPSKSLATKSTALKSRLGRKSETAAESNQAAPEVKVSATVQAPAVKTAPGAQHQGAESQGASAPATKPRHSLKTKRRSAAPEVKEEIKAAPMAAPATEPATEPAAAPKRRATLKSHSLKRVRPQAPSHASGE